MIETTEIPEPDVPDATELNLNWKLSCAKFQSIQQNLLEANYLLGEIMRKLSEDSYSRLLHEIWCPFVFFVFAKYYIIMVRT